MDDSKSLPAMARKFELCGRPLKIYDNGNADRKPHYLAEFRVFIAALLRLFDAFKILWQLLSG